MTFDMAMPRAPGALAAALVMALAGPAAALDVPDGEMAVLKACEAKVCRMILNKEPVGEDLKCNMTKTWGKAAIKGGEKKTIKWGFGDARCSVGLTLGRSQIYSALTQPKYTLKVPAHTVRCEVEREGELQPVKATLAPKLEFKNGRADKLWINLQSIDGPSDIKSTVSLAASLEDNLGLFHSKLIEQINKFMYKKCEDNYGVTAKAATDGKAATAAAEAKPAATAAAKTAPAPALPPSAASAKPQTAGQ